jgi:dihydroorotate dehydrogenase electron transfer subunit
MEYAWIGLAENARLRAGYFVLRLEPSPALARATPGQFVMLRGDWGRDPLLPRAFSLLSAGGTASGAEILIKTLGRGSVCSSTRCRGRA